MNLPASDFVCLLLQTLCLEVWHHCPRSQAVAAALSQGFMGRPAEGPGQRRDVFLGSASAPLGAVLNKPQVSNWQPSLTGPRRASAGCPHRAGVGNCLHEPVNVQGVCPNCRRGELPAYAYLHVAQKSAPNRPQDGVQASLHTASMPFCQSCPRRPQGSWLHDHAP